jgi:hypothetical protein
MSPKLPPIILEKWFRGLTPRCRGDELTQSISEVMGSAHTHKCLHTGRNPVCCGKPNSPANFDCFSGEAIRISGASPELKDISNYLKILNK